jgi:hypothetical protein
VIDSTPRYSIGLEDSGTAEIYVTMGRWICGFTWSVVAKVCNRLHLFTAWARGSEEDRLWQGGIEGSAS